MPSRIFLLSPASSGGERAALLLNPRAGFDLARRLRSREGAALGEVFSFLSGLYFRAKLLYATSFARTPAGLPGCLVITPGDGLRSPDERVNIDTMNRYARIRIDARNPRYRRPLLRDGLTLARAADLMVSDHDYSVVLLGSIATGKYVDVLGNIFRSPLMFPVDFVGRGDMSRGGLLLRCVDAGQELSYVPVKGAVRHGPRPPKLQRRR
jgi:hypothetical protein